MASDHTNIDLDKKSVEFRVADMSSCTSCHTEINLYKQRSVFQHPILGVLVCEKCFGWYSIGKIERGEDGEDLQCRWCGDGGDLFCCNNCSNVFCKDCITINLGEEELKRVESTDKWFCYVCDNEPLCFLRDKYNELKTTLENDVEAIILSEDEDEDDATEGEINAQRMSEKELDHLYVKNLQLSRTEQETAKHNLQTFEERLSSLVPISRALSNSLSRALRQTQFKRIDLSREDVAMGKLDDFYNKINSNLHNLLSAFSSVKSSKGSKARNVKKGSKEGGMMKNDRALRMNVRIPKSKEPSSQGSQSETTRIELTISEKSQGLTSDVMNNVSTVGSTREEFINRDEDDNVRNNDDKEDENSYNDHGGDEQISSEKSKKKDAENAEGEDDRLKKKQLRKRKVKGDDEDDGEGLKGTSDESDEDRKKKRRRVLVESSSKEDDYDMVWEDKELYKRYREDLKKFLRKLIHLNPGVSEEQLLEKARLFLYFVKQNEQRGQETSGSPREEIINGVDNIDGSNENNENAGAEDSLLGSDDEQISSIKGKKKDEEDAEGKDVLKKKQSRKKKDKSDDEGLKAISDESDEDMKKKRRRVLVESSSEDDDDNVMGLKEGVFFNTYREDLQPFLRTLVRMKPVLSEVQLIENVKSVLHLAKQQDQQEQRERGRRMQRPMIANLRNKDDGEGLKGTSDESDEDTKKKKRRRVRMESSSEDDDDTDVMGLEEDVSFNTHEEDCKKIFRTLVPLQREKERQMKLQHQPNLLTQMIVKPRNMKPVTMDEEPSTSSHLPPTSSPQRSLAHERIDAGRKHRSKKSRKKSDIGRRTRIRRLRRCMIAQQSQEEKDATNLEMKLLMRERLAKESAEHREDRLDSMKLRARQRRSASLKSSRKNKPASQINHPSTQSHNTYSTPGMKEIGQTKMIKKAE